MTLDKIQIIKQLKKYYKKYNKSPISTNLTKFTFTRRQVVYMFGSWNKALLAAKIPLNRNKPKLVQCYLCNKVLLRQVKDLKKSDKCFCSSACSASYYTTGRKHTEETKLKISNSLKAHKIFNIKTHN